MSGFNPLIRSLIRRQPTPTMTLGLPVALIGAMTLVRLLAPLYFAPFLLYIPVLLIVGVALGWRAGAVSLALSTAIAALFYVWASETSTLSGAQIFLLIQYAAVGGVMVLICDALRQSTIQNEATLDRLNGANQTLVENQSKLRDASDQAEAARLDAEAARETAEQANLAKSAFIANMSHELRTPLSAIIGYSEMMMEELADGGTAADFGSDMRKIESNARHLLGLINDVLDLSKVESGKMDVYPEDFELDPIIRDVAATAQALIEQKANRLALQVSPDIGRVTTDLTKVRQILLNLLSNAAKFTETGTVTLTVDRVRSDGGATIVFTVADTGIGMSAEQLSRLFQRFVQADASTTRKYGGTGLGLSLTKALSEMLGGTIEVASEVGTGTTVTVKIPALYQSEAGTIVADRDDATAPPGDLVLVIDDDADQRALMTKFLNREGFAVRAAVDGVTGLSLARELKPRAILLDVMMPGIDGWSVLSALKQDEVLNAIPVIMVTFVEQRALAVSLGAADYVMKPVRWDRFKAVMDRYRPPENTVLVIDDDADARERIRRGLERDGWMVTEAENGREGLQRLHEARPGIVLLDLTMPVMDGFEFFETMRAQPDFADLPVVVLTALDLTSDDRRRLRGASQILHKGDVSLHSLAERLKALTPSVATLPAPQVDSIGAAGP